MNIDIDIEKMMTRVAKRIVDITLNDPLAPKDTGDLLSSITAGDFNPSDNSIDVYINTDALGVSKGRKNIKPWHGKYYPELVHGGHKTRYNPKTSTMALDPTKNPKSFISANPFFTRAMQNPEFKDLPIDFIITETEFK